MSSAVAGRCVRVVVIMMLGSLAGGSYAADEAKPPALPDTLAKVGLFAGLTDAERDSLKPAATLRQGKAGERIIEEGKLQGKMIVIMEGEAEIRVKGKLVVTLSGQSLVGEIEFLDTLPASADVILLRDTNLIELNNTALAGLMEKQPRLGYVLMREIARIESRRLRASNPK